MGRFDARSLCLRDPLACQAGHLFCKECAFTGTDITMSNSNFSGAEEGSGTRKRKGQGSSQGACVLAESIGPCRCRVSTSGTNECGSRMLLPVCRLSLRNAGRVSKRESGNMRIEWECRTVSGERERWRQWKGTPVSSDDHFVLAGYFHSGLLPRILLAGHAGTDPCMTPPSLAPPRVPTSYQLRIQPPSPLIPNKR